MIKNSHYWTLPKIIAAAVGCLFPLLLILIINAKAYNIPVWDEYDSSLPIALATSQNDLSIQQLVQPHNGHRIFFTNVVTVFLTLLTDWNLKIGAFLNVGIALVTLTLLMLVFHAQQPEYTPFAFAAMSLFIFSPRQSETWLTTFGNQHLFVTLFFVATLWVLLYFPLTWRSISLSGFFAACATFSFGSGLVIWGCVLPILWFSETRKRQYILFWVVAATLAVVLYFYGNSTIEVSRGGINLLKVTQFVLVLLASPVFDARFGFLLGTYLISYMIGVLVLLAAGFFALNLLRVRHLSNPNVFWVALMTVALLDIGLISQGRAFLGLIWANSPRYSTHTTLFWIGLVGLVLINWQQIFQRENMLLKYGRLLVFVTLLTLWILTNVGNVTEPWHVQQAHVTCLATYPSNSELDCLQGLVPLHPDDEVLLQGIENLYTQRLSLYANLDP